MKASEPLLRFGIITGITHFREFATFSSMNSFTNITFDPMFSTICGFTVPEFKTNFNKKINSSFLTMQRKNFIPNDWTVHDFTEFILEWYNGYTWDGNDDSKILNPQSIIDFSRINDFQNYWYSTAGPNFIDELKFLRLSDFLNVFDNNLDVTVNYPAPKFTTITPQSALFQCGYLTFDKIARKGNTTTIERFLKVPNKEVKISISDECRIGNNP